MSQGPRLHNSPHWSKLLNNSRNNLLYPFDLLTSNVKDNFEIKCLNLHIIKTFVGLFYFYLLIF